MSILRSRANTDALVSRLRDLEAACLRLSGTDLHADQLASKNTYEERLQQLQNSHSHSWFGDHSFTYFDGFQTPPPSHSFDVEWGFISGFPGSRNRGWRIYARDEIRQFLFHDIGDGIFYQMNSTAEKLADDFAVVRDQVMDVLEALAKQIDSRGIGRYLERVENDLKPYKIIDFINSRMKNSPSMSRDSEEIAKGKIVPTHVQFLAPFSSITSNKNRARELAGILRNVIEASMLYASQPDRARMPNKVFIGHGKSEQWRVLKDFLHERLGLEYDEFNRISAAGINTQERLGEMLDNCGFAFLVLAGEDLHGDGSVHARENVIHEAGLFQGRLGWRKAIILLEEGCDEFSNIVGLGQIRFARGQIQSCFEEVRRVLERETLLTG